MTFAIRLMVAMASAGRTGEHLPGVLIRVNYFPMQNVKFFNNQLVIKSVVEIW